MKNFNYYGRLLVKKAALQKGWSVLDAGCGSGATLFPAAISVGDKGSVTGIDISEKVIEETRSKAESKNYGNISLLVMNGENLCFDLKFDAIICGFAISSFSNIEKSFNELIKHLKKGSVIALSNWHEGGHKGWEWLPVLLRAHLPASGNGNVPIKDTVEGMRTFLSDMKMKNIVVTAEEKLFYFRDQNEWWKYAVSSGIGDLLEKMDAETLNNFKKESFKKLNEMKTLRGIPFPTKAVLAVSEKP